MQMSKNKPYKRIALALSLCTVILWGILGTGASIAWFTDTTPEIKNIINMADFEAEVLFKTKNGNYEKIDGRTDIFSNESLYEPGYTQIVYFKVNNKGDIPFKYQTAVIIDSFVSGTNMFGQTLNLQEYLRFGVVNADTENELDRILSTRQSARTIATSPLNRYESSFDTLNPGQTGYMALVVYMPDEVGNDANYRGLPVPEVKLGISVNASQIV